MAALAGHRGDEAVARRLRRDPDPEVRATALGALARMGALGAGDLIDAADDAAPVVRRRAAEELGRWHRRALTATTDEPTSTAPGLLALLDDPDDGVAEAAAWAAGECYEADPDGRLAGEPDAGAEHERTAAIDRLVHLAEQHTDPLVREAAVAALGAIGDRRGLHAVLAATRDKPAIRRRAVIALTPFDGPDVDEALARARHDRDWQVRQLADELGGSPDPTSPDQLDRGQG